MLKIKRVNHRGNVETWAAEDEADLIRQAEEDACQAGYDYSVETRAEAESIFGDEVPEEMARLFEAGAEKVITDSRDCDEYYAATDPKAPTHREWAEWVLGDDYRSFSVEEVE